jgi:acetylornithine deacetylase/succinyl-diaminopimelate desuccinylase-like protein
MSHIRAAIETHRERFLAEFCEFLSFPSESSNVEGLAGAADWVTNRLAVLDARVQVLSAGGDAPPAIFGEVGTGARSLFSYSHYDVQPPDPLEQWESPPYQATVRDGKLYARGAVDDKGDTLARIHAAEIYRAVYGELPLRLKFFVEGEEEVGSPHLAALAERHADLLRADGAIWEGGGFDDAERYTFYCGVKGIAYLELRIRGAAYDLHSGYAPMAPNPAWRLVRALSTLKDDRDNITVDGLLAHVRPPTAAELAYIRRIPFDGAQMKANWGLDAFVNGMGDEEALARFITAPTCTICGLRSGFIEEGEKTVLPSAAMVKLDFRLVPDLTPELVTRLLREHLNRRGYTDIEIHPAAGMVGARSDVNAPLVQTAIAAARAVYGHEPVVYPSHGGSGPMHALVQGVGTPAGLIAGVCYPGMRMHAPNENVRLDDYFRHIEFLVEFMRRFADNETT